MDKITMDTANLEHIPESKRGAATSYESLVSLYTESDLRHDLIPEGKSVGDVLHNRLALILSAGYQIRLAVLSHLLRLPSAQLFDL